MTTTATERSESRTERENKATHTTDSVYVHDSVYIREAGDTVFLTQWRVCWRERTVHDTVTERTTDTVRLTETVEVVKTVEVPEKSNNAGWVVALTLLVLITIYILIKTFLNRH